MQLVDRLREHRVLVEVKTNDIAHSVRKFGRCVVNHASDGLETCRPLRNDQPELAKMSPHGVDQLGALPAKGLAGPECDSLAWCSALLTAP